MKERAKLQKSSFAIVLVDTDLGQVWTRVLHYRYNCDINFQNCRDEEQFFLANGYGLWQWKHFRNGALMKTAVMNEVESGSAGASLPCPDSYQK